MENATKTTLKFRDFMIGLARRVGGNVRAGINGMIPIAMIEGYGFRRTVRKWIVWEECSAFAGIVFYIRSSTR
jgi:hypothetical protein